MLCAKLLRKEVSNKNEVCFSVFELCFICIDLATGSGVWPGAFVRDAIKHHFPLFKEDVPAKAFGRSLWQQDLISSSTNREVNAAATEAEAGRVLLDAVLSSVDDRTIIAFHGLLGKYDCSKLLSTVYYCQGAACTLDPMSFHACNEVSGHFAAQIFHFIHFLQIQSHNS